MNLSLHGNLKEFRDLLCHGLGCHKAQKPKDRLFVLEIEGVDEPIPKGPKMRVKLSRPIKPGERRRVNLTPDEPLDRREDGTFAAVENVEGDSTVALRVNAEGVHESDAKKIRLWVNGDGALGTGKVNRIKADGHVGPEVVEISLELEHDVASKDATEFSSTVEEEGADEPIPV